MGLHWLVVFAQVLFFATHFFAGLLALEAQSFFNAVIASVTIHQAAIVVSNGASGNAEFLHPPTAFS